MSVTGTVVAVDRDSWGDDVAPSWRVTVDVPGEAERLIFEIGRVEIGAQVTVPVRTSDGHAELAGGVKLKLLGAARGEHAPLT